MSSFVVFALIFGNPLVLWGLGAASVPIIIHLLNKRRFRETQWAAMDFLLAAIKKNARRMRLEQLLLLAIRTLLLLLLIFALAEPFLERAGVHFIAGNKTHKVLVLDGSFSMGYKATNRTRFERAKEVAQQIIRESKKGDMLSVVLMAEPPRVIVGEPSPNRDAVSIEIENLEMPHGGADLPATLARVATVLEGSGPGPEKEVYFISDLGKSSWLPGDGNVEGGELRSLVQRIGKQADLIVVDLAQGASDNLAVVDVQLGGSFVAVDQPTELRATVHNFGRTSAVDQSLELVVDGRVEDRRRISVQAGEETTEIFSHRFSEPGERAVEVRLEPDLLDLDNHRWQALPVREYLRVLCVNGRLSGDLLGGATDYLSVALSPEPGSQGLRSRVRPDVIPESRLTEVDLNAYDSVILCDIGQFTESDAQVLEGYLQQGGEVIWFLGPNVVPERYNEVLYRDGKGIFPARLVRRVGDPQAHDRPFFFDPLEYRHPVVAEFDANEGAGLVTARTFAYLKMQLDEKSPARTVLAYNTDDPATAGDPAIIEQPMRRGWVIVVSTSADASWTGWPVSPSYLPVVHELVAYGLGGKLRNRNVLVGQPLAEPVASVASDIPITVVDPAGHSEPLRVERREDYGVFLFDSTDTSGIYRVDIGPPLVERRLFAANVKPAESDLTKLDRDALREQVFAGTEFAYVTHLQSPEQDRQLSVRQRGDLHRMLLYGVLALLLAELFLAWKFGHYST